MRKRALDLLDMLDVDEERRERPPVVAPISTMAELKARNRENGGHWFSPANMKFFNSRIESGVLRGRYFISSERFDENSPRLFSVRSFDEAGEVDTVGEFQAYRSKAEAVAAVKAL